jgi:Zn-dependent protease with chaperone function
VLGRVLGRVLAHEIGHYVLRSPRHASGGLMASLQFADDLIALSRHRFMLTAPDRARLEEGR